MGLILWDQKDLDSEKDEVKEEYLTALTHQQYFEVNESPNLYLSVRDAKDTLNS
jgi:hypothetical protein